MDKKDCPDFNPNNNKCCNGQVPCSGLERCRKKYPALHRELETWFDDYGKKVKTLLQKKDSHPIEEQKTKQETQKQTNDDHRMNMTMGELHDWLIQENAKATEEERNLTEEEKKKLHYV